MAVAASEATDSALATEEARLAHAAADGDGAAFATLYERYERRAYNLAVRITGSDEDAADAVQDAFLNVLRRLPRLRDRELAFGSYLFTATRNACYDLMQRRRRAEPSDSIPESAAPLGSGAGGLGLDPGDPDDDPDRRLLLASQQEEIRSASARLPERQREALALRELEELSYDEIAAIMDMNRNSVAQLISRARIKLRDELRGTALASIATSSPECERALPLIALLDDGQLDEDGGDAAWLDAHLAGCDTCRLGREAMQEAGTSYRAWVPVAAAPWLFEETMARAAELAGADWSEIAAQRAGARADLASLPGIPRPYLPRAAARSARRRRRLLLAAALGAALLAIGAMTALGDGDPDEAPVPAAGAAAEPPTGSGDGAAAEPDERDGKRERKHERRQPEPSARTAPAAADATTVVPSPEPTPAPGAEAAPDPDPKPDPRPKRPPKPPAGDGPPVTEEPPVTEDPPVAEEPPVEHEPPPGPTGPEGPRGTQPPIG